MHPRAVVIVDERASVTGGATRVAIDEATGLAATGLSVTYLAPIGPISPDLLAARIRVVLLDQQPLLGAKRRPSVLIQTLWNSSAYRAMNAILDGLDPMHAIVHLHSFSQTLSGSPIRCALNRGFTVVATLHDYFSVCPNGGFFDYRSEQICERRPLSLACVTRNCDKRNYAHKLYRVTNTIARQQFGRIPSGIKHYIGLSQSSVQRLRPYLPEAATFFLLQNPCAVERSSPVATHRNKSVAAIGRLSPEKGIEVLVDAASRTRTELLFIGDGPLRRTAEASGIHRVSGWLPRHEVFRLLETVRCLVLPSVWPEPYGLSVIDAAARGVPSIATSVSGAAEWISHETTGWQVPPGSVDALAACLEAVHDNSTVARVGQAAYTRYWESPLSLDVHIKNLRDIYARILIPH